MTKEEEEKISERFRINLRNAIHELTTAMCAIDRKGLGYALSDYESDYEDAGSCIVGALRDIQRAVLLYEKKCDWIDIP